MFQYSRAWRIWFKAMALGVTASFLFPYLAFAFETATYPMAPAKVSGPAIFKANGAEVKVLPELGRVVGSFAGKAGKTVIYIHDLHCNYEVQSNIATLLDTLAQKNGLRLVGIEGESKAVNVSALASFPVATVKNDVGQYFLKRGRITGAEYLAATGSKPLLLEGIESQALYDQNKSTLLKFLNDETQGYCEDLKYLLEKLKAPLYSMELAKLDHLRVQFDTEAITLETYCNFLVEQAKQQGVSLAAFPVLSLFVSQHKLSASSESDYDRLLNDAEDLDRTIRGKLYTSEDQRVLDRYLSLLKIVSSMVSISATSKELDYYRAHQAEFSVSRWIAYLDNLCYRNGVSSDLDSGVIKLDERLKQAAQFYQVADKRSDAFVQNMLGQMDRHQQKIAVLITGGFHSLQVEEALQKQGVSFLTIKPRITHTYDENPYFSLLRNQRAPIEQLLGQNEKIFAPPSAFNDLVFVHYLKSVLKIDLIQELMAKGHDNAQVQKDYVTALGSLADQEGFDLNQIQSNTQKKIYSFPVKGAAGAGEAKGKYTIVLRPSGTVSGTPSYYSSIKAQEELGHGYLFQIFETSAFEAQNKAIMDIAEAAPARAGVLDRAQAAWLSLKGRIPSLHPAVATGIFVGAMLVMVAGFAASLPVAAITPLSFGMIAIALFMMVSVLSNVKTPEWAKVTFGLGIGLAASAVLQQYAPWILNAASSLMPTANTTSQGLMAGAAAAFVPVLGYVKGQFGNPEQGRGAQVMRSDDLIPRAIALAQETLGFGRAEFEGTMFQTAVEDVVQRAKDLANSDQPEHKRVRAVFEKALKDPELLAYLSVAWYQTPVGAEGPDAFKAPEEKLLAMATDLAQGEELAAYMAAPKFKLNKLFTMARPQSGNAYLARLIREGKKGVAFKLGAEVDGLHPEQLLALNLPAFKNQVEAMKAYAAKNGIPLEIEGPFLSALYGFHAEETHLVATYQKMNQLAQALTAAKVAANVNLPAELQAKISQASAGGVQAAAAMAAEQASPAQDLRPLEQVVQAESQAGREPAEKLAELLKERADITFNHERLPNATKDDDYALLKTMAAVLDLLPTEVLKSPTLHTLEVPGYPGAHMREDIGSYDGGKAVVAAKVYTLFDGEAFIATLLHEIGHSLEKTFTEEDFQKLQAAHATLFQAKALIAGKYGRFTYTRVAVQESFTQFIAEFLKQYVMDAPELQRQMQNTQNPAVAGAFRAAYEVYHKKLGREYHDPAVQDRLTKMVAELHQRNKDLVDFYIKAGVQTPVLRDAMPSMVGVGWGEAVVQRTGLNLDELAKQANTDDSATFNLVLRGKEQAVVMTAGELAGAVANEYYQRGVSALTGGNFSGGIGDFVSALKLSQNGENVFQESMIDSLREYTAHNPGEKPAVIAAMKAAASSVSEPQLRAAWTEAIAVVSLSEEAMEARKAALRNQLVAEFQKILRARDEQNASKGPSLTLPQWESRYLSWMPKVLRPLAEELVFRVGPLLLIHALGITALPALLGVAAISAGVFLALHAPLGWNARQWAQAALVTAGISVLFFGFGLWLTPGAAIAAALPALSPSLAGGLLGLFSGTLVHYANNWTGERVPLAVAGPEKRLSPELTAEMDRLMEARTNYQRSEYPPLDRFYHGLLKELDGDQMVTVIANYDISAPRDQWPNFIGPEEMIQAERRHVPVSMSVRTLIENIGKKGVYSFRIIGIKPNLAQRPSLAEVENKFDDEVTFKSWNEQVDGASLLAATVVFASGASALFRGNLEMLAAVAARKDVVEIIAGDRAGWLPFLHEIPVAERAASASSKVLDALDQKLGEGVARNVTGRELTQGQPVFHGTLRGFKDSLLAGPKDVGKGFGGQGLYLALERSLADFFAKWAADEASSRIAHNAEVNIQKSASDYAKPAVLRGQVNPTQTFRVGRFKVTRDGRPDLAKGVLPADWSNDPLLNKYMNERFDVLELLDMQENGLAIDTDRFLVMHERSGARGVVWETFNDEPVVQVEPGAEGASVAPRDTVLAQPGLSWADRLLGVMQPVRWAAAAAAILLFVFVWNQLGTATPHTEKYTPGTVAAVERVEGAKRIVTLEYSVDGASVQRQFELPAYVGSRKLSSIPPFIVNLPNGTVLQQILEKTPEDIQALRDAKNHARVLVEKALASPKVAADPRNVQALRKLLDQLAKIEPGEAALVANFTLEGSSSNAMVTENGQVYFTPEVLANPDRVAAAWVHEKLHLIVVETFKTPLSSWANEKKVVALTTAVMGPMIEVQAVGNEAQGYKPQITTSDLDLQANDPALEAAVLKEAARQRNAVAADKPVLRAFWDSVLNNPQIRKDAVKSLMDALQQAEETNRALDQQPKAAPKAPVRKGVSRGSGGFVQVEALVFTSLLAVGGLLVAAGLAPLAAGAALGAASGGLLAAGLLVAIGSFGFLFQLRQTQSTPRAFVAKRDAGVARAIGYEGNLGLLPQEGTTLGSRFRSFLDELRFENASAGSLNLLSPGVFARLGATVRTGMLNALWGALQAVPAGSMAWTSSLALMGPALRAALVARVVEQAHQKLSAAQARQLVALLSALPDVPGLATTAIEVEFPDGRQTLALPRELISQPVLMHRLLSPLISEDKMPWQVLPGPVHSTDSSA